MRDYWEPEMTFRSEFKGNETDSSGIATFEVGTIKRDIPFDEFTQYHAVAQLLNEARQVGREEAAKEFASRVAQFARDMGATA
jgi:hypothetical protein